MLKQDSKVWTIRELMKVTIDLLQQKGFEEARLNVELMLAHALQFQRIQLYTSFDKPLSKNELREFRQLIERRLNREPVQYIVGSTGFMGLQFKVDKRALIPRPETEILIEQLIIAAQDAPADVPLRFLEIGTGSGNIAISLAKYIKNAHVTTIDDNEGALHLAQENAKLHDVEASIEFRHMSAFEAIDQLLLKRFNVLVSNPPYASIDEWEQLPLEIKKYEPRSATTDGKDGYEFYRHIAEIAPYLLVENGLLAVEVGFGQAATVKQMFAVSGATSVNIIPDLEKIPRVVMGRVRSKTRAIPSLN